MKREYESRQLQKCSQNRRACLANKNGYCNILDDTHFDKVCPFYKTKAMVSAQLKGASSHG